MLFVVAILLASVWFIYNTSTGSQIRCERFSDVNACLQLPLPTVAVQSPVDTAYAWFSAMNARDVPLALAHLAPALRPEVWSGFDSTSFSDVNCRLNWEAATSAEVFCSFSIHNAPRDMQGTTFWNVYMEHQPQGPWLIYSYGQG